MTKKDQEEKTEDSLRCKKACLTCKRRKKKCSGGLPCEYCRKIDRAQCCEYTTRLPKKTVRVSERYISSLKAKISSLEKIITTIEAKDHNYGVDAYVPEQNPLIQNIIQNEKSPEPNTSKVGYVNKIDQQEELGVNKNITRPTPNKKYFGDSSCSSFLVRIHNTLTMSSGVSKLDEVLFSKQVPYYDQLDWDWLWDLCIDLPPLLVVKEIVASAEKTIGADYLFIEPDYIDTYIKATFYQTKEKITAQYTVLNYAEELARFYSYLALGHLFGSRKNSANEKRQSNGFIYFETALNILSALFKHSDKCSGVSLIQAYLYVAYYCLSVDKGEFAYTIIGNAIRVAFTLGIHKHSQNSVHNRIFWLCFLYDRLIAIRFGYPLMINENDIDIPLWNNTNFRFMSVSLEKYHFEAQISLAKITTHIIQKIYTKNNVSFVHNCYAILKELKEWHDDLSSALKLDYIDFKPATARSTVNLHINYNYLIILTTRSVVFYVFNKVISSGKNTDELFPEKLREIITILLDSSIQAAKIQSLILTRLFYAGKMMNRSYLDCHYIFNSSIVLILAAFLQSLPNYLIKSDDNYSVLFNRVQDNLDVLQNISQSNVAAYNFNKQLTELIELISSVNVQEKYNGQHKLQSLVVATPSINVIDSHSLEFDQKKSDVELFRPLDLSQVLDFMVVEDGNEESSTAYFDDEDFFKYSNFVIE